MGRKLALSAPPRRAPGWSAATGLQSAHAERQVAAGVGRHGRGQRRRSGDGPRASSRAARAAAGYAWRWHGGRPDDGWKRPSPQPAQQPRPSRPSPPKPRSPGPAWWPAPAPPGWRSPAAPAVHPAWPPQLLAADEQRDGTTMRPGRRRPRPASHCGVPGDATRPAAPVRDMATAALKPAGASADACPRITSPSSRQRSWHPASSGRAPSGAAGSALRRRPAHHRPGPTAARDGAGPGASGGRLRFCPLNGLLVIRGSFHGGAADVPAAGVRCRSLRAPGRSVNAPCRSGTPSSARYPRSSGLPPRAG